MEVEAEITVDRPIATVAAFVSDVTNTPLWQSHIKAVEWITPGPPAEGSRFYFATRLLCFRPRSEYVIAEWVPNERMVIASGKDEAHGTPLQVTCEWHAVSSGVTLMRVHQAIGTRRQSPGIALFNVYANRHLLRQLKRLKNHLEAADG